MYTHVYATHFLGDSYALNKQPFLDAAFSDLV